MTITPETIAELKRIEAGWHDEASMSHADARKIMAALPALIAAAEENARLREAISEAIGRTMNASISLTTGVTKVKCADQIDTCTARLRAALKGGAK